MDSKAIRIEARKFAAENWYRGVQEAVMAGHYDEIGDVVKLVEMAILKGIALAEREAGRHG